MQCWTMGLTIATSGTWWMVLGMNIILFPCMTGIPRPQQKINNIYFLILDQIMWPYAKNATVYILQYCSAWAETPVCSLSLGPKRTLYSEWYPPTHHPPTANFLKESRHRGRLRFCSVSDMENTVFDFLIF